jgi:cold shock protein
MNALGPVERGTVRFYRPERQYGYIIPDDGTADVFVHARSLDREGITTLAKGERVDFQRVPDNKGFQAYNLRVVTGAMTVALLAARS